MKTNTKENKEMSHKREKTTVTLLFNFMGSIAAGAITYALVLTVSEGMSIWQGSLVAAVMIFWLTFIQLNKQEEKDAKC